MTLFAGLDLNASRVWAVQGSAAGAARPLVLDAETGGELPLALGLEGRRPEVGSAGVQLCRRSPHLACTNFLPQLGGKRRWDAGRHRLDADKALALVLKRLHSNLENVTGIGLALPPYLSQAQTNIVASLMKQAKLPSLGWVSAPLAAAWMASGQQSWHGLALIVDVDDHALTCSAITVDDPAVRQAKLLAVQALPALGLLAWEERLLNGIAERCIRQSRRDPRECAAAEQMLWEQFDAGLEACRQGKLVELVIQSEHWYQDLVLRPEEMNRYCSALVKQALAYLRELLTAAQADQPPAIVLATMQAARLPGLLAALAEQAFPRSEILALPDDAIAVAAWELAGHWHEGVLPRGPIDRVIPLKKSPKSKVHGPKSAAAGHHTKLPARGAKRLQLEDEDFSVRIDE
jgi:hypothetical protein